VYRAARMTASGRQSAFRKSGNRFCEQNALQALQWSLFATGSWEPISFRSRRYWMADPAVDAPEAPDPSQSQAHSDSFLALSLGAMGVVFGDIGTSPLYAMREALAP
jgi:hypothetical protein